MCYLNLRAHFASEQAKDTTCCQSKNKDFVLKIT